MGVQIMNVNKRVRLDLICIDGGTQHRDIDEETMQRYLTLMEGGVEFPAIELVFDGKVYWLWDGFHRYHCAKRQKQTVISANVINGSQREAIWLSFSANKDHGLPRQKGVAKEIIERILADKAWSKKSLSAIAKHVGVTKQYVSQVKDGLLQRTHGSSTLPTSGKNGDSEPETAQGSSTLPLSRDTEIEVKTKAGIPYTQRSQEKQYEAKEPEPLKDSVGRVIPEHLCEVYAARSIIWGLVSDLAHIRDSVTRHLDNADPTFSLLNITRFQADYENLRRTLKSAMPYAVCPYCGGDGKQCKACHGLGLLNKNTYEAAPGELKK